MFKQAENNKLIAKNTFMLYIRMIFIMGVTLYTSRVILQVLGVEDFGLYNVVGGIIAMFAFINASMVSATQRFLTFELAEGNLDKLRKIFSTALQIHAVISLIIIILGETIGLWFLYNKMIIPEERMNAAFWVYQCSIVSTVVNFMSIPYNATIVAHERMEAFAYISVIEVVLKLLIVYLLLLTSYDRLIIYAILILLVQTTIRFIYSIYCRKHFQETHYENRLYVPLFKDMLNFATWSFWGNLASVLSTQGINLLLNVFFGSVVNAARGIAVQVQGAVTMFVSNFQMALNPQITKNYAEGNLDRMHTLMFCSARFSFYLLFLIVLPILLETPFLLSLWLGIVPEHTVVFTRITLLIALFNATAGSCIIANQATGKVKKYQMVVGANLLFILPVSYVCLKLGASPYIVFWIDMFFEIMAQFLRIYMLRSLIELPIKKYILHVYKPIIEFILVATIFPLVVYSNFINGWERFLLLIAATIISVIIAVYIVGLTNDERTLVTRKILKIRRR